MFQMPFPLQPLHMSQSNISDGGHSHHSDTISESSDNATLLSLSREDLSALGAGPIRDDVRVSRKKLESLILHEREHVPEKGFMESLMDNTNTYIQWPSRMKIGAKTKKDLFVRIYGHNQDEVNEAKSQVLQDLGPHRDLRITLKMEISYTDHSHLIGCRGATIRKVMEDTGCHIHFPDSNRMSKDHKSNQVTIAGGSLQAVEQARARVRELSPLILQFQLPMMNTSFDFQMNPDAHHIFIDSIQTSHNVQVTIHPPNKLQQTTVSVKGCEVDSLRIKDAIGKIVNYFAPGTHLGSLTVESTMEISAVQHSFVRAVNDSNVHGIMMNTGAKIIFPDLSDNNIQQIKRSRIYIGGDINSVYFARQQLIGCLPLRMIFDLADDYPLDWESVRLFGTELNVNVKLINRNSRSVNGGPGSSLPPPVPGRSRTIQLIAAERNTASIYEARRLILGGQEPKFISNIPLSYALRPMFPPPGMGNRLNPPGPLPPLMLPTSPNMMSPVLSPSFWPPTPFASPFCSPPISTCVLPTGPMNNSNENNGPPGFGHIRPRQFNQNPMQQFQPQRYGGGGFPRYQDNFNSRESSPRVPKTPTNSPLFKLPEPREFYHPRRAPGYERSNTNPSILVSPPDSNGESEQGPDTSGISSMNITTPLNQKKFMAMKAMYQSKIGNHPRSPNSEWSGMGFSKTHTSLFPMKEMPDLSAQPQPSDIGECSGGAAAGDSSGELPSTSGSTPKTLWTTHGDSNKEGSDSNNNRCKINENGGGGISMSAKTPLCAQQSNLLECTTTPTNVALAELLNDLPTLLIQNGLDKYIDRFIQEEIDLRWFSTLTEDDLRSLGVTAYPARKKMLLLITQLAARSSQ